MLNQEKIQKKHGITVFRKFGVKASFIQKLSFKLGLVNQLEVEDNIL